MRYDYIKFAYQDVVHLRAVKFDWSWKTRFTVCSQCIQEYQSITMDTPEEYPICERCAQILVFEKLKDAN